ncbi:hypothetical protein LTR53_014061 [Teratosphaeriaceae sp. CCFEE 6253]|nr:hypothetical protein LTR53_014061 [Teratosphaeriaceae sp. CCFEE 6253]
MHLCHGRQDDGSQSTPSHEAVTLRYYWGITPRAAGYVVTMDLHALTRRVNWHDRRTQYVALTAPIVGYYAARLINTAFSPRSRRGPSIFASPLKSLPTTRQARLAETLPYPPDALPGGRDVPTPYGSIRVYEWGPATGRKVLFIHGISTPCIAFAGMAQLLVDRGYRVMLFDLFGRGYSDTPDPAAHPQDIRLFTSQVLLVLASSALDWMTSRFTLVGYSLGGGIGAAFTACFPRLVGSLVLIAPAGLVRPKHISWTSKLLYGGMLPQWVVRYYVANRLRGRPPIPFAQKPVSGNPEAVGPAKVVESEVPSPHPALAADSAAPLFADRPDISPANAVAWQLHAHPGFLPAFISSIQYAPISNEHERWRTIGRRQSAVRTAAEGAVDEAGMGLREGKVLILLGAQDQVIVASEVEDDATVVLGKDNVDCVTLEGGHDVPIVNAKGCADALLEFLV